ncbi:MAG: aconitase family protein [Candidatus Fermentibacteraceae bacterium]
MGETFALKILGRAAGHPVSEGDDVSIEPDLLVTYSDTGKVLDEFRKSNPEAAVKHPERLFMVLDGAVPPVGAEAAEHGEIRRFAASTGVRNLYEPGSGACQQVLAESFLALPGSILGGTDGRTSTHGAFNCAAFRITIPEAAEAWRTGTLKVVVPETVDIQLTGGLRERVSSRDLALAVLAGTRDVAGKAVEFHGSAISGLRIYERMTLAGAGVDLGASITVFPADGTTEDFLCSHSICRWALWSDSDAVFAGVERYDLDSVTPMIAPVGSRTAPLPVGDLAGKRVDVVLLGFCENGGTEDLQAAADVMRGRKTAPAVRLFVCPASRDVYLKALRNGLIEEFVLAGASVLPPGCGISRWSDVLAPGELCISTSGSGSRERSDNGETRVCLTSPETAAAAAVTGVITDPREV